jgi:heme/copper-type cytochrome/quinol oxidase subunit 1
MHSLVRRYLKTAIGFLAVGLLIGFWLIVARELGRGAVTPHAVSAHTHAILVGFVMLMILGVALWLFPRPAKEDARYQPRLAEAAYWLVTLGTAARVAGELARGLTGSSAAWLRWGIVLGGTAQMAGLGVFFYTMWSRIRPVGSVQREARGERF